RPRFPAGDHPHVERHPLVALVEGALRAPGRYERVANLPRRMGGELVGRGEDRYTIDQLEGELAVEFRAHRASAEFHLVPLRMALCHKPSMFNLPRSAQLAGAPARTPSL